MTIRRFAPAEESESYGIIVRVLLLGRVELDIECSSDLPSFLPLVSCWFLYFFSRSAAIFVCFAALALRSTRRMVQQNLLLPVLLAICGWSCVSPCACSTLEN